MVRLFPSFVVGTLVVAAAAQDAYVKLQEEARPAWEAQLEKSTSCTKDGMRVRREW